jgi:CHAD domain-containing protein
MALRITSLARRAASRRARSIAAAVADGLIARASGAAGRLRALAESLQELRAPSRPPNPATEVVVTAATFRPAPPRPAAPPRSRDIGDRAEATWSLAGHLRMHLEAQRRHLARGDAITADAHDPETIRRMRIASRRLRAFLELFGAELPQKLRTRTKKDLRRVTRALGPVREQDAIVVELGRRHARARDPLQRAALEHVLESVERRRSRARRQATTRLADVPWDRLHADLAHAANLVIGPWIHPELDIGAALFGAVDTRIAAAFARAPQPESLADDAAVHGVRVQMKRLRYAFEIVAPALGTGAHSVRRPLKTVQRAIGSARDLGQLRDLLRRQAAKLDARDRCVLGSGLAAVVRDVEASWHQAQASLEPALAGLSEERLRAQVRRALLPDLPPMAEAAQ